MCKLVFSNSLVYVTATRGRCVKFYRGTHLQNSNCLMKIFAKKIFQLDQRLAKLLPKQKGILFIVHSLVIDSAAFCYLINCCVLIVLSVFQCFDTVD